MILVAGASGMVGGEVCRLLSAQGEAVRALVRPTTDPDKLRALRSLGVELVTGDVRDRDSLDAACRGVRVVVSALATFQSRDPANSIETVERQGQINLIDAARAHGVEHFIPSTYGLRPEHVGPGCPLVDAKAAAERHLVGSGMEYTILYNALFMEAWLSPVLGFDALGARARVYGSGRNPLNWISFRDVTRVIVTSIADPRFRNQTLELAGADTLSPREVVRIFEEEGGASFEVEQVPEEMLDGMAASAQDPLQKTVAVLLQQYARGLTVEPSPLQAGLPIRWTTVREYARALYAQRTEPTPVATPPAV